MPSLPSSSHNPVLLNFADETGRIGLLGGSFDPVHYGHIAAARSLIRLFGLQKCVLIPAHRNPLKPAPDASDADRLAMLAAALETEPDLFVSPIELPEDELGNRPSYSVETLQRIREQAAPGAELFFFIGSDAIPSLHQWKDFERLMELARVVVYARDNHPADLTQSKLPERLAAILAKGLVEVPPVDISGRQVRKKLSQGCVPRDALPAAVADYIQAKQLYGLERVQSSRA